MTVVGDLLHFFVPRWYVQVSISEGVASENIHTGMSYFTRFYPKENYLPVSVMRYGWVPPGAKPHEEDHLEPVDIREIMLEETFPAWTYVDSNTNRSLIHHGKIHPEFSIRGTSVPTGEERVTFFAQQPLRDYAMAKKHIAESCNPHDVYLAKTRVPIQVEGTRDVYLEPGDAVPVVLNQLIRLTSSRTYVLNPV